MVLNPIDNVTGNILSFFFNTDIYRQGKSNFTCDFTIYNLTGVNKEDRQPG